MKQVQDNFEDDFGFVAIGEQEFKEREVKAVEHAIVQAAAKDNKELDKYKQKLKELHDLIMPLLKNLQKNSNKEYIYWPDRKGKIDEFILKVKKIALDYEPL